MSEHKVEKGETLSGIAKLYGMSLGDLLKVNGIDPSKANNIQIGQVIKTNQNPEQPAEEQSLPLLSFSSQIVDGGSDWAAQSVAEISRLARGAELAAQARRAADQKANAGVKAPMKPQLASKERTLAINLQELLHALGYDLGTHGIDGYFGNSSKKALALALADGYVLLDGKLIKSETNTTPNPAEEEQGIGSDFLNYVGRVSPFTKRPYKGTEEEARKLGYAHYTTNGFTRHPVSYDVEGSENMTPQLLAQALLNTYGITSELVRDKSPIQQLVYQYSPGYGYNLLRMGENMIRGNKVRENGQRNTETIETPVADKLTDKIANALDFMGFDKKASDFRESNTYPINESAQRNDLSNLYFGYPMNGKTLKVSDRAETGKGNKPKLGYFLEFANASHIYLDPAYKKAESGGAGVLAQGENMGNWSASIDANGNKAYYDDWDINPFTKIPGLQGLSNMLFLGTNFELYGKQRT